MNAKAFGAISRSAPGLGAEWSPPPYLPAVCRLAASGGKDTDANSFPSQARGGRAWLNQDTMDTPRTFSSQIMIDAPEADLDVPEANQETMLTFARYLRNHQVAAGYAVDHLPSEKAVEVLKLFQAATPDQLGKLYDQIHAEKTLGDGGGAKALLLDIGRPETISLQANNTENVCHCPVGPKAPEQLCLRIGRAALLER